MQNTFVEVEPSQESSCPLADIVILDVNTSEPWLMPFLFLSQFGLSMSQTSCQAE